MINHMKEVNKTWLWLPGEYTLTKIYKEGCATPVFHSLLCLPKVLLSRYERLHVQGSVHPGAYLQISFDGAVLSN